MQGWRLEWQREWGQSAGCGRALHGDSKVGAQWAEEPAVNDCVVLEKRGRGCLDRGRRREGIAAGGRDLVR